MYFWEVQANSLPSFVVARRPAQLPIAQPPSSPPWRSATGFTFKPLLAHGHSESVGLRVLALGTEQRAAWSGSLRLPAVEGWNLDGMPKRCGQLSPKDVDQDRFTQRPPSGSEGHESAPKFNMQPDRFRR